MVLLIINAEPSATTEPKPIANCDEFAKLVKLIATTTAAKASTNDGKNILFLILSACCCPNASVGSSYFANTTCLVNVSKLHNININPTIFGGIIFPNINGNDINIQNNAVPYFLLLSIVVNDLYAITIIKSPIKA